MISIRNFEKNIEEKLLKKGSAYFSNGAVIDLEETQNGSWEANVEGTDQYFVEIKLNEKDHILHYSCDCPFDGDI